MCTAPRKDVWVAVAEDRPVGFTLCALIDVQGEDLALGAVDHVRQQPDQVRAARYHERWCSIWVLAKHPGGAPSDRPADSDIWVAQAAGAGTQSLTWPLDEGSWTVVVMNADGSGDVDVNVDVGATAPIQPDVARWLQIGSIPLGVISLILVLAAARRSRRQRTVAGHPS